MSGSKANTKRAIKQHRVVRSNELQPNAEMFSIKLKEYK